MLFSGGPTRSPRYHHIEAALFAARAVRAQLNISQHTRGLVRRDVTRRAECHERPGEIAVFVEPFGQTEIAHQRFAATIVQDVAWFQNAMENALAVRV